MNVDFKNIIAEPVEMFFAERLNESSMQALPLLDDVNSGGNTIWHYAGASKKKGTKLSGEVYLADGADGTKQTGIKTILTTEVTEISPAMVTVLENSTSKYLDFLLRVIGTAKVYLFERAMLKLSPTFPFSFDGTNTIALSAVKDSQNISSAVSTTVLENYFNIFNPLNL